VTDHVPHDETVAANRPDLPAPGEEIVLTVEKIVTGGAGLARHAGAVVFVPGTAPGEKVRARVVRRRRGFLEAEVVEILTASPERVPPPLGEVGSACGLDLQHLAPAAQRQVKAEIVRDCFRRLAGLDVSELLENPPPAGPDLGYRHKIRLWRAPDGRYGMRRRGSHDVVPVDTLPLLPAVFDTTILPWLRLLPPVDEVVIRLDERGGWLVSLFGPPGRLRLLRTVLKQRPGGEPPAPGCVGVLFNNRPLWGRDHLLYRLGGHTYRVGAGSFFQVNPAETEAALAALRQWLDEAAITPDRPAGWLVDLYCGVGLFSLALADRCRRLVGVEQHAGAVRDARNNLRRDRAAAGKGTIVQESVTRALWRWSAPEPTADDDGTTDGDGTSEPLPRPDWSDAVVVFDPPRRGLGADDASRLADLGAPLLVGMACDPAALARDMKVLAARGYRIRRLRMVDMFPHTSHVEVLVLLTREPGEPTTPPAGA